MSTCPVNTGHQFNARGNCMHCFAKQPDEAPREFRICGVFASNRCTICGTCFADGGDEFCGHGHQIGETYPTR